MFFLKDSSVEDIDGKTHINRCVILYPGQHYVQMAFVVIAMLCIPVMLFAKPIILYRKEQKKSKVNLLLL